MTELTFTKSFLSTLDARPLKLQPDYCIPASDLDLTSSYTLPKLPTPMRKPSSSPSSSQNATAAAAAPTTTATSILIRSTKTPPLDLRISEADPAAVTILELKERVVTELGGGVELGKVKLLWGKKPVTGGDARTVREVLGGKEVEKLAEVEFGVLVMGYKAPAGGGAAAATAGAAGAADAGESLDDAFWEDLRGFLQQRLKDEGKAEEVVGVFKGAWEKKS